MTLDDRGDFKNIEIALKLFQILVVCLLVLSLAGYFGKAGKYLELASHFKLQYLLAALFCLLVFSGFLMVSGFRVWPWVLAATVCLMINAAALLPCYFPVKNGEGGAAPFDKLRVMQSNVLYENMRFSSFIELVREEQPDILIAQEVTTEWLDQLEILREIFPHVKSQGGPRGGGIALYSRFPLVQSDIITLDKERPAINARLGIEDRELTLFTFHTHAPLRKHHFDYRNNHLRAAADLIKRLPAPLVVIGDLNTTMWSPYFDELVQETGLFNTRCGFGLLPTWPSWFLRLPFLMLPIDHCLVSPGIGVHNVRTRGLRGSDHHSLIVDLSIPLDEQAQKGVRG